MSMKNQVPLILTSDHFFDTIKFQEKSDIEKIAYIMFYVTEVAHFGTIWFLKSSLTGFMISMNLTSREIKELIGQVILL